MPPAPAPALAAQEASTKATATDIRGLKARARAQDDRYGAAYRQGQSDAKAGRHEAPFDEEVAPYYQQGHDDTTAEMRSRPSSSGPPSTGAAPAGGSTSAGQPAPGAFSRAWGSVRGSSATESGAGLLLGAILYANVVNYLRGGMPAVRGWYAAKFMNKPYGGQLAAAQYQPSSQPSTPAVPSGANAPTVGPPIGVPSVLSGP